MAVIYSSDTFIPALNTSENFLKIRDIDGNIRYKIYNNKVSSLYVNLDTVIIKTESDSKVLNLKFKTRTEAENGLVKLQAALAKIKENFQIQKDSKFSDLSFEIYNDTNKENFVNFDLNNLTTAKTLTFGEGIVLQTETEVSSAIADSKSDVSRFRFFEHFLLPTQLLKGSFTSAIIKSKANEVDHFGILEMTLNTAPSDAYLWSSINSFMLNNSTKFSINFRVNNLATLLDSYRIAIGFFNQNDITNISKGAHFLFDLGLNNNWLVRSMDSTSTIQNTLNQIDTSWHTFTIQFNENNELEFLIDDNITNTIDTNIPNSIGSEVSFGVLFEKNTTTQATSLFVDWIKFDINF